MAKSFRIGIALGGGGARGIAHLGVLSVLGQARIPIDVIAGTSFGALVGAMYAIEPDVQRVQKRISQFLQSPEFKRIRIEFMKQDYQEGKKVGLFSKLKSSFQRGIFYGISFSRWAYLSEEEFIEIISHLIDDIEIEKTKIPFLMNAADLMSGKEVVLDKGPLRKAICATCALPGIFPPISYGEHLLIDGGWINPVPVELARRWGADFVIAVITPESIDKARGLNNGLDLLLRADALVRAQLTELSVQKADVVIRPDIGEVHWADFSRPAAYIQRGMEATENKIKEIKQLIQRRKIRKLLLG